MIITNKIAVNTVRLGDLLPGTVFKYDNGFYLKVDSGAAKGLERGWAFVVNLESARITEMSIECKVIPLKSELIIS